MRFLRWVAGIGVGLASMWLGTRTLQQARAEKPRLSVQYDPIRHAITLRVGSKWLHWVPTDVISHYLIATAPAEAERLIQEMEAAVTAFRDEERRRRLSTEGPA